MTRYVFLLLLLALLVAAWLLMRPFVVLLRDAGEDHHGA